MAQGSGVSAHSSPAAFIASGRSNLTESCSDTLCLCVSTDLTPSFNVRGAGWVSPGSLAPRTALWFHLRFLREGLKS